MMVVLRLFAAAREAAGTGRAEMSGATVSEVLDEARARFGDDFTKVLAASRVWLNGQPADEDSPVSATDEVAVLPPVSGG
jgi:MoaD family protein